ncbi:hypothetical protein GCM10010347_24600 [Streptomyces cirratus]|uniref:Uncharacterized protein n=1 Tax=Streptomyces cirratus TaxID=68187 RepID=A0ABQ3ER35_9ACTN|nr:hypothetical protein GCM10010347_24600 [Streptomyces cirratus]
MSATVPRSSTAIDGEKAGTPLGLISSGAPRCVRRRSKQGGGTPDINADGNYCKGGTWDGEQVD